MRIAMADAGCAMAGGGAGRVPMRHAMRDLALSM
jgi:hypothetical protein